MRVPRHDTPRHRTPIGKLSFAIADQGVPMSRHVETVLFWLMLLLGAALLVPGVLLPPWLEYKAQHERYLAAQEALAGLEHRLEAVETQVEHLRDDPAYAIRLAEREFRDSVDLPGTERVPIASGQAPMHDQAAQSPPAEASSPLPALSEFVDQTLARYPYSRWFVQSRTRPIIMLVGAGLLLTALVFLGRAGTRRAQVPADNTPPHA